MGLACTDRRMEARLPLAEQLRNERHTEVESPCACTTSTAMMYPGHSGSGLTLYIAG